MDIVKIKTKDLNARTKRPGSASSPAPPADGHRGRRLNQFVPQNPTAGESPTARLHRCKTTWPTNAANAIAPPPKLVDGKNYPLNEAVEPPGEVSRGQVRRDRRPCLPPRRRSRSRATRWSAAPSRSRTAAARTVRVLVFAKGAGRRRRPGAGAEFVGFEDMIKKCQRRLPGFRRRHRHARRDGGSPQARQGARPARPDAQPEDRHRDRRHRQGRQGSARPAASSSSSTRTATSPFPSASSPSRRAGAGRKRRAPSSRPSSRPARPPSRARSSRACTLSATMIARRARWTPPVSSRPSLTLRNTYP